MQEVVVGDLSRNWGALVLRGVLAVVFGVAALLVPGITLAALVFAYGAYAFADGIVAIVLAVRGQGGRPWWSLAAVGILGIGAGIVAVLWPGITALALLWVIAAWSIATGVFEVVAAVRLRRLIGGEWLLALAGLCSIAFGLSVAIWPGAGALAVLWLIGAWSIAVGVVLIALGIRLRRLQHAGLGGMVGQPA